METIATVNFEGNIGKTVITWLLAKYAAEKDNKKVLAKADDGRLKNRG